MSMKRNHLYLKKHLLSVSKKHVSFAFQWKIHKKMFPHTLNMKKKLINLRDTATIFKFRASQI